jgi:hypothetical protein
VFALLIHHPVTQGEAMDLDKVFLIAAICIMACVSIYIVFQWHLFLFTPSGLEKMFQQEHERLMEFERLRQMRKNAERKEEQAKLIGNLFQQAAVVVHSFFKR